jgi:hypothetical protein
MKMEQAPEQELSTTQIGAIGEAVVATGLMFASRGRLSPYKPIADDDGTDLLVIDKDSRKVFPIQVKCRTKVDNTSAETVQFDVRLKTFTRRGEGFLLAALLDGTVLKAAWLIPSEKLADVARSAPEKLVIVPSAKRGSKDKYVRYRHQDFESVALAIREEHARSL